MIEVFSFVDFLFAVSDGEGEKGEDWFSALAAPNASENRVLHPKCKKKV